MTSKDIIKKLTEYMPGFKNRIEEISLSNIDINEFNPRKKFGQVEEDELIESINSKCVLQPVIVYLKKGSKNKYILLDGQRRFQACKKLGVENIPAHIITKEPTFLENLSLMFHIHNVHEDWTDLAIAKTLEQIIRELKIDKHHPKSEDIENIKKLTSLSKYKIKKFFEILQFSRPVLDRFMEAELKEKPDLDLDMLSELRKPIKRIKKEMPSLMNKFPEDKIVEVFVQKKKDKVITTNKQIRKLSKIVSNVKRDKIDKQVAIEKISNFLSKKELSVEEIYADTSEAIEQAKIIIKTSSRMRNEIDNIDLRKLPEEDKDKLYEELNNLKKSIERKL